MGELFDCPAFPHAAKLCWCSDFSLWMKDLKDENYINADEFDRIEKLKKEYYILYNAGDEGERYIALKQYFTMLPKYIVNDKWDDVHKLIQSF